MRLLPRILGFGLLGALILLLVMSCESTKQAVNEFGSANRTKGEAIAKPERRQIVHFTDTSTIYVTSRRELAAAFIRQFGDGTVIDNIQVRKAPTTADEPFVYYLIGLGLRNGMFRAMALPLNGGGDNTYYLRPTAERYVLTAVGCPSCFFNFEEGRIVNTSCSENLGGSRCDLKVESGNTLFAAQPR